MTIGSKMTAGITSNEITEYDDLFRNSTVTKISFNLNGSGILRFSSSNCTLTAIELSDKFCENTGAGVRTVTAGTNILQFVSAEDSDRVIDAVRAAAAGKDVEIESEWMDFGGKDCRHTLFMRMFFIGTDGDFDIIYMTTENIADSADKNKTGEHPNIDKDITDNIPVGLAKIRFEKDKCEYVYISRSLCNLFGYSREEIKRQLITPKKNIHPDDLQTIDNVKTVDIDRNRGPFRCRYRRMCSSGKYKWIEIQGRPAEDDDDKHLYYVSFTDVTITRQNEDKMRVQNRKFQLVLESENISVWYYDIASASCEWQYRTSNEVRSVMTRIYGVPETSIANGYISEDSADTYREMYAKVARGVSISKGIIHMKKPNGQDVWISMTLQTVFNDGKPVGANGYSADVTNAVKMQHRYFREMKCLQEANDDNLIDKGCLNITQNTVESYTPSEEVNLFSIGMTAEEILESVAVSAATQEQKKLLRSIFSRENLYQQFMDGNTDVTCEFQRKIKENDETTWVRMTGKLFQEPYTDDIKAFMYSYDISEERQKMAVVNSVYCSGYTTIGVIGVGTNKVYFYRADLFDKIGGFEKSMAFPEAVETFLERFVPNNYKNKIRNDLSVHTVICWLRKQDKYKVKIPTLTNGESGHKHVIFSYLDERKTKILVIGRDTTNLLESDN